MFVDTPFAIPASAPIRFLAVTQDGATELYEHPAAIAQAVAETLRTGGMRIVWYPFIAVAPAPAPQPQAPRRERRQARREQKRQFAELGVTL